MKLFETELMSDLTLIVGPSKLIGNMDDVDTYKPPMSVGSSEKFKNKFYAVDECSVVEFKVHRAILCARCDYFNRLFHSQMKDCSQAFLKFPDKRPDDFKCLLDFFYSAVININHSNAFGVLKLSDELGVQVVKGKCIEYVKECVTSDNVFDVLEESTFHNFDELRRYCKEYLEENANQMFFSESFLNITKETLIDLLKSDKIHLSELDIFSAVIIWGKHQLMFKMGIQFAPPKSTNSSTSNNLLTTNNNTANSGSSTSQNVAINPTKTVITYGMDGTTKVTTGPINTVSKSVAESITERNLSISEQQPPMPIMSELSVSEQHALKDEDEDETDKDGVDDDEEEEVVNTLGYSALNPESMLLNQNRKQDADELREVKERMLKIINYTHDKQFCTQLAKLLHDILQHIRFPTLDPIELYEFVEISKVVPNELLLEAYRAHSLQNRIEVFNSPRMRVREGSLFYVSGVCENVPISKLKGWCLFYHKPYHHPTSEADIQAAKGTRILIGARHKNSNTLALCAMGRKDKILRETFENETTKENGCFFYHWKNHSFGFSDTTSIQLGTADLSEGKSKISWHLTGRGGYRCGFLTSLNESKEWEKMLFYA